MQPTSARAISIQVHDRLGLADQLPRLETFATRSDPLPLSRHPGWLLVLERGLDHEPFCLEVLEGEETRGILPLSYVRSLWFGRFLVSLPYLNYGGVMAVDDRAAGLLIDRAVKLAAQLGVRHLELRHEMPIEHPLLTHRMSGKVHMRRPLPANVGRLWAQLSAKVRNQVRKGQKEGLTVAWGGVELVPEFYDVFCRNMRDLGTPVFSRRLFTSALQQFPDRAELCVIRAGNRPVAAAFLAHGWNTTEVPSASSLRRFNSTCANMLMYWNLLVRSVERGQSQFDFGRSTPEGNTYRFKVQWGALPQPSEWQYHLRFGSPADMRPDNPRYQRLIWVWRRLPVPLTRLIGPLIVRGIP